MFVPFFVNFDPYCLHLWRSSAIKQCSEVNLLLQLKVTGRTIGSQSRRLMMIKLVAKTLWRTEFSVIDYGVLHTAQMTEILIDQQTGLTDWQNDLTNLLTYWLIKNLYWETHMTFCEIKTELLLNLSYFFCGIVISLQLNDDAATCVEILVLFQ